MEAETQLEVEVAEASLAQFAAAYAPHTSSAGIRLWSSTKLPVGAQTAFTLRLRGGDVALQGVGSIEWSRGGMIGLRFLQLDGRSRLALAMLLEQQPPAAQGIGDELAQPSTPGSPAVDRTSVGRGLSALRMSRASAALHAGDVERAERELKQAISEAPFDPLPLVELGALYADAGGDRAGSRDPDAEECFTRALALDAGSERALLWRGRMRARRKHFRLATADFRALLAASPRHPGALEGLQLISAFRWKHWTVRGLALSMAAALWALACGVSPSTANSLCHGPADPSSPVSAAPASNANAGATRSTGENAIRVAAPSAPEPARARVELASVFRGPVSRRAIEWWMRRGDLALQRADLAAAFEAFDHVRRIDRLYAPVYEELARLYRIQGRPDLASDAYRTFVQLDPGAPRAERMDVDPRARQ